MLVVVVNLIIATLVTFATLTHFRATFVLCCKCGNLSRSTTFFLLSLIIIIALLLYVVLLVLLGVSLGDWWVCGRAFPKMYALRPCAAEIGRVVVVGFTIPNDEHWFEHLLICVGQLTSFLQDWWSHRGARGSVNYKWAGGCLKDARQLSA